MKVDELKNFLRLRGLKVSGKKEELAARVFVAYENNLPIKKTAEEVETEIASEYQQKLLIEDGVLIPDPLTVQDGWLSEDMGIKFWPLTLYPDIFNFLAFHPNELASSDLSDYKTSKAYNYYSQGWLSPLHFHNIEGDSKVCLLKGSCRPSQRINDTHHKLWICIAKKSGKILRAHCTCMAGLSQTCNHVAAALFRIEAASRMGLNNPSCTSLPCQWLPNNKLVKNIKIKDLKLARSDFGRRGKKRTEINSSPKKAYKANSNNNHSLSLGDIVSALNSECSETPSIINSAVTNDQVSLPKKEQQFLVNSFDDHLLAASDAEEFKRFISDIKAEEICSIEQATRGQSDNPDWFSYRKHVVTASKAHEIKTKMETANRSKTIAINFAVILEKVGGQSNISPDIPALKYGRSMEEEAVNCFSEIYKKGHKNVKIEECGLFLSRESPFIGGSPDRIVRCDCCGSFCLEVKCPYSIRYTSPVDENVRLPYLRLESNGVKLNHNHKYFTQCQVQMAATGLNYCYFFVWTAHGFHMEKLEFDAVYWSTVKDLIEQFYNYIYIPSLFN